MVAEVARCDIVPADRGDRATQSTSNPVGTCVQVRFDFSSTGHEAPNGIGKDAHPRMLTFPPDYTFLIQLGTFFVLLTILARLLFAPFLELLDERDQRTAGDIADAASSRSEVEALSARVDAELSKARAAAMSEVESVRRETKSEAKALFDQAQSEAASRLVELRSAIAQSAREARGSLASDARAIADQMVDAVLGRGGRA